MSSPYAEAVVGLVHEHAGTGLAAVAISSNSVKTHPQDGPDLMVEDAKQFGASFLRLTRVLAPLFGSFVQMNCAVNL